MCCRNWLDCLRYSGRAETRKTRILIDAKDLINVVEHGTPVSAGDFDFFLRDNNASLALTHTNVCEFVAPISKSRDFLSIRPFLQRIEALPVCYLREPSVPAVEITAALDGFTKGVSPSQLTHTYPAGITRFI